MVLQHVPEVIKQAILNTQALNSWFEDDIYSDLSTIGLNLPSK